MSRSTRREFVGRGAALLASSGYLRALPGGAARTSSLTQFEYGQVQLLDGPMLEQFRQQHALYLNLDEDSMLKPFRQLTGQPAPGEDMGGWYSPSTSFDPPKNMTGYIPGHSFGQYLSGLSRAYAVTGDRATQQKVHRLVRGFAPTAETSFYRDYCIPAYTFDKTNCGMIDAHQFAGDPMAFSVLNKATDAVLPWLPEKALDREEMNARPHKNVSFTWDETYTLPENFYLAYTLGAGTRYRELARRFLQDDTYFNPLAAGKNVLPGQHAYSHVNALCSAMQAYLVDGSERHLNAARNGMEFVLQQSFATGGWGPNESFREPGTDQLAESLEQTHSSFETPCGAYGHFKISRYLMRVTGQSSWGDGMERVLYNTILGARPTRPDGTTFYYSDYNRDAAKADYEQKWPCCSGTFPQITADYGISTYLHATDGVYVNLYVPSRVSWRQGAAKVSMTQLTEYPNTNETSLRLQLDRAERFTVALRIPAWVGPATRATINGREQVGGTRAGDWLRVDRMWKDGDCIELAFDMPLRLVPLDERHPGLVALMRGPVALFAVQPVPQTMTRQTLLSAQRSSNSAAEWRVATGGEPVRMLPFTAITTERYRLYNQT